MTSKEINQLFEKFTNQNILIIGDVMIDSYLWGSVDRISPEAPVPVVLCTKQENRLGGAANVALNVQSLGANPILCAVIGNDDKKNVFLHLLTENKLTSEGILSTPERTTTVKTRIICGSQHLLRVDQEMKSNISSEIENLLIERIINIISEKKIHAIIFEDYDKGVITQKIIDRIVEEANIKNIPTLVDPKKRNFLFYKNVTLFKPNFKELTEGLKIDIKKRDFESIHQACIQLHQNYNQKLVMVTLSELGILISDSGQYHTIPAEIREITDVSGAGDTVISTAALCLANRVDSKTIASISNLAGGIVCEKVGVVPINKQQLLNECIDKLTD